MSKTNRKIHPEGFREAREEDADPEHRHALRERSAERVRTLEDDKCPAADPKSSLSRRSSRRADAHRGAKRDGTCAA
jgi:hypothetical protein